MEQNSNTFKTDHARVEQAFCSAPGLFMSLPKRLPKGTALDVTYETTEASFNFFGRPLGVTELRVFQGVIALAPLRNENNKVLRLTDAPRSEMGKEHLKTLRAEDQDKTRDTLIVKSSFYELAKEIGYADTCFDGGAQIKAIKKSLETIWSVTVLVRDKRDGSDEGVHILSRYQATKDGKFTVAINPRLAEAVLGNRRFSRIEMNEIRALKSDPARFIHQRLCGFIDPGKSHRLTLETLCGYVWADQALNINLIKYRKRAVKKALAELESLGWSVDEYVKEKYQIARRGVPN